MPIHTIGVGSFAGALVARISKDNLFFTVQQRIALRDIVDVSRRADDRITWCISGSRSPALFLVELGAAINVASTTVPALSNNP